MLAQLLGQLELGVLLTSALVACGACMCGALRPNLLAVTMCGRGSLYIKVVRRKRGPRW